MKFFKTLLILAFFVILGVFLFLSVSEKAIRKTKLIKLSTVFIRYEAYRRFSTTNDAKIFKQIKSIVKKRGSMRVPLSSDMKITLDDKTMVNITNVNALYAYLSKRFADNIYSNTNGEWMRELYTLFNSSDEKIERIYSLEKIHKYTNKKAFTWGIMALLVFWGIFFLSLKDGRFGGTVTVIILDTLPYLFMPVVLDSLLWGINKSGSGKNAFAEIDLLKNGLSPWVFDICRVPVFLFWGAIFLGIFSLILKKRRAKDNPPPIPPFRQDTDNQ